MKNIYISDYEMLAYKLITDAKEVERGSCCICKFADAAELTKTILQYPTVNIESVSLEPSDWNGYDWEYSIELSNDLRLFVEPVYVPEKDTYLSGEEDILYIFPDCDSRAAERYETSAKYEVEFSRIEETEEKETEISEAEGLSTRLADLFKQQNDILREIMEDKRLEAK